LSPKIGIIKPLSGVTNHELIHIIDIWIESNPDIKKPNVQPDYDVITFPEALTETLTQSSVSWNALKSLVNPELAAGLHALFYFAYDSIFTEYYQSLFSRFLDEISIQAQNDQDSLRHEFMHVYEKTNFLHHTIQSLYALGQRDLAEHVIAKHSIEHAFHWLDQARRGTLFAPPTFAQYPER
jgi:hypothetical protein